MGCVVGQPVPLSCNKNVSLMHPSKLRVYKRVATLFSTCSFHTGDCSRQFLWSTKSLESEESILGRQLPESFRVFLQYDPLFVPNGWVFFGFTAKPESSIESQNSELLKGGILPDGWLHFANFCDDGLFSYTC